MPKTKRIVLAAKKKDFVSYVENIITVIVIMIKTERKTSLKNNNIFTI